MLFRSLICYSVTAVLENRIFDEVMVSTDSDEVASIATEYGAKVLFIKK